ncbi:MAG: hypothetical protein NC114_10875 [Ruminococcus flavefaciens]|nr:hypothetical protein [Ruminococcus flavefaciens]
MKLHYLSEKITEILELQRYFSTEAAYKISYPVSMIKEMARDSLKYSV